MYISFFFFTAEVLRAAPRADWAAGRRRPAVIMSDRVQTEPAQPLNSAALGSCSRASAHFHARCARRETSERRVVARHSGTLLDFLLFCVFFNGSFKHHSVIILGEKKKRRRSGLHRNIVLTRGTLTGFSVFLSIIGGSLEIASKPAREVA